MANVKLKNNYNGNLFVAGVDIRPGATVAADETKFKQWRNGTTAKLWLDRKIVEVVGVPKTEPAPKPEPKTEPAAKSDSK